MAEQFKVGDVVNLVMTIEDIRKIDPNSPIALCSWSVGGKRQQEWFPLAVLVKAGRGEIPRAAVPIPRRKILFDNPIPSSDAD